MAMTHSSNRPAATLHNDNGWDHDVHRPIAAVYRPHRTGGRQQHAIRRNDNGTMPSLIGMALLTLVGSSGLIDVYGTVPIWALGAVPATACGITIAHVGHNGGIRHIWQVILLMLCQCLVGPVIACNDTTIVHVLPTWDTVRSGWRAMCNAFAYLIATTPPVDVASGSLMAVWMICLWGSFLAGTLACARHRILMPFGIIVPLAVLIVCALLGTASSTRRIATGVAYALIAVIWLSRQTIHRYDIVRRRPLAASVVIVVAVGLATSGALMTTPHRLVLRDRHVPPVSVVERTSPLSGMRAYVKRYRDDVLLTVDHMPSGAHIRIAVMDAFDGNIWSISDGDAASAAGAASTGNTASTVQRYRPWSIAASAPAAFGACDVGNRHNGKASDETDAAWSATLTIGERWSGIWLPLIGTPDSAAGPHCTVVSIADGHAAPADRSFDITDDATVGTSDTDNTATATGMTAYYHASYRTAILPSGVPAAMSYTQHGVMTATPTDAQINDAKAAYTPQPVAQEVPKSVSAFASTVAGGVPAGGAAAQALADALRDRGWFSQGSESEYPSPPGHGSHRIDELLSSSMMVGDSEQYASAMALMARELGMASRVVFGFRTDIPASTSASQPMTFTGNDVEAWVEILLEQYGWVAFHPTPDRAKQPDAAQQAASEQSTPVVRQPPAPLVDQPRDDTRLQGGSSVTGQDAEASSSDDGSSALAVAGRMARIVAVAGSPVWVVITISALVLLIKALTLARWRRTGDVRQRITAGWHALRVLSAQSGVALNGTHREQASRIARSFHIDADLLQTLAARTDHAAFSGEVLPDRHAESFWNDVMAVRRRMLVGQPPLRRLRTRLSLRSIHVSPSKAPLKVKTTIAFTTE
ncbi:transglutaminase [Bifidobacterium ramosum]|uniref:Transglutaminase n=1 Tax=Bifidobacterium ramosum TaxID=1798158 RepID=A0A6L4X409_9BIFI|nr:transglutaminase-like domain-containing protein [Bifidobacterium ramosum]KAB8288795.1 transglutaminase [Bifidobacterium ramosum]NEG71342.1 transglutaminase domain-containing protein [Bifidobacterium ramosum]